MRSSFVLTFILCAQVAVAAPLVTIKIKGVSLGMSEQQTLKALGTTASCHPVLERRNDSAVGPAEITNPRKEPGAQSSDSRAFSCSKHANDQARAGRDTFAGKAARIRYNGNDDRISEMTVDDLSPTDFDETLAVIGDKFGEPGASETSIVTVDRKRQNSTTRWRSGDLHAEFVKYSGKGHRSRFRVWNASWIVGQVAPQQPRL